jgi:hypothetical protein
LTLYVGSCCTVTVVAVRPEQCLRDDDALAVERDGRAAVQPVSEVDRLADPVAERGVVRPGQHPVARQPLWRWWRHESRSHITSP